MLVACPAFVLKKVAVSTTPKPQSPPIVEIVGREEGIMAWLLTMIGFTNTHRLTVSRTGVTVQIASLRQGQLSYWVPLKSVSVVTTGYVKPFALLILAAICCVAAIPTFGLTLIPAAILFIAYFLLKKLAIVIGSDCGDHFSISVKRSVIEGVSLSEEQALEIVQVIRDVVLEGQHGLGGLPPDSEVFEPIAVTPGG